MAKRKKKSPVEELYYEYFNGISVKLTDTPRIWKDIEAVLSGDNVDEKMKELVVKYKFKELLPL